jgi:hypothetical protein
MMAKESLFHNTGPMVRVFFVIGFYVRCGMKIQLVVN